MGNSPPSTKAWKALYKAAIEFRDLESWDWMREADVFGVQNPKTGEIGYCCIMGSSGQVFAMAVYLGAQGYTDSEGRLIEDNAVALIGLTSVTKRDINSSRAK